MTKEKKTMEYEDAPSGFVTLYHYKEPFMKFEEGHGYRGVLLFDGKTDTIQCHFCGEWQTNLHHHLKREHSMNAAQYKERVGLQKTTALINESLRESLIAKGMDKRLLNLRSHKKHTEESKKKISASLLECRMEVKNKMGTCPLQLLDRLKKDAERLGRVPTGKEVGYRDTLMKVYGSFNNAVKKAGLTPREIGQNANHAKPGSKYTREDLIETLKDFKEKYHRYPSTSDIRRRLLPTFATFIKHFGSWTASRESAFPEFNNQFKKPLIIQDILIGNIDVKKLQEKHKASRSFIYQIITETQDRLSKFQKMTVPA